jgi:cytochrome c oxidase assembly protein subunit 15
VALVALNIVTGGAVRLTDSGLGCPDWPDCFKKRLTPSLSLHPAIEFGNRMVVVILCISAGICVVAALRRVPYRRDLTLLSCGLVVGILGEAVLGAIVVYSKLNPYAVMTHFTLGIAVLSVAFVLASRAGRAPGRGSLMVGRRELHLGRAAMALLVVAVVAGTATTAAGPHAGGSGAKRLPVALTDMARTHSGIVLALGSLVLVLLYLLEHTGAPGPVIHKGRLLLAAMVVQGIVGYTQYFTHLPALLVGVHVLGVTVVWGAMYMFVDGLRHHRPEVVDEAHEHGQVVLDELEAGAGSITVPG